MTTLHFALLLACGLAAASAAPIRVAMDDTTAEGAGGSGHERVVAVVVPCREGLGYTQVRMSFTF